jgi:hypothetical protein
MASTPETVPGDANLNDDDDEEQRYPLGFNLGEDQEDTDVEEDEDDGVEPPTPEAVPPSSSNLTRNLSDGSACAHVSSESSKKPPRKPQSGFRAYFVAVSKKQPTFDDPDAEVQGASFVLAFAYSGLRSQMCSRRMRVEDLWSRQFDSPWRAPSQVRVRDCCRPSQAQDANQVSKCLEDCERKVGQDGRRGARFL